MLGIIMVVLDSCRCLLCRRGGIASWTGNECGGSAIFQGSGTDCFYAEAGSKAGSKRAAIYALPRFLDLLLNQAVQTAASVACCKAGAVKSLCLPRLSIFALCEGPTDRWTDGHSDL